MGIGAQVAVGVSSLAKTLTFGLFLPDLQAILPIPIRAWAETNGERQMSHTIKSSDNRKRKVFRLGVPAGIALTIVIAFAFAGSAGAASARTAAAPVNTAPPTISGTPTEGQKLTGSHGSWSGSPTDYNDNWRRCDKTGASCSDISGSSGDTYTLTSADVGNTVRFQVGAANADGRTFASSVPSAVIAAAATTTSTTTTTTSTTSGCTTTGGTVPIADITSPAHLNLDQFQVSPSTITYATRSFTARFHVSACGGSVQGALVLATPIPYGMFAAANEQTTGSDGWASVNFVALAGFPVSQKQQLLVMFVRARKSGENLLGGISARRLVSFKVSNG